MLAKKYRLSGEKEFKKIYSKGKFASGKYVNIKSIFKYRDKDVLPKVGIVVSKKISSKAVIRNKLKRQAGEIFYLILASIKKNSEIVVMYKKIPENFIDLKSDIENTLKKINLYD